jgi:GTP cyclohydrolase I
MIGKVGVDYYGGTATINGDVDTTKATVSEELDTLMGLITTDPDKYYGAETQERVAKLMEQKKRLDGMA